MVNHSSDNSLPAKKHASYFLLWHRWVNWMGELWENLGLLCAYQPPLEYIQGQGLQGKYRGVGLVAKLESSCYAKKHSNKKREEKLRRKKPTTSAKLTIFVRHICLKTASFLAVHATDLQRTKASIILEKWISWASLYFKQLVILSP